MSSSAPITERRYVVPLVLVTSLFFYFGLRGYRGAGADKRTPVFDVASSEAE